MAIPKKGQFKVSAAQSIHLPYLVIHFRPCAHFQAETRLGRLRQRLGGLNLSTAVMGVACFVGFFGLGFYAKNVRGKNSQE